MLQWTLGYMCSFELWSFSGYIPSSGAAVSYGNFIPTFLHTVLHSGCINVYSHHQRKRVGTLFSTSSTAFIVCRCFDDGHSNWCEVIHHCSFDLHFSNKWGMLNIFSCVCWPSVFLLWRNVCLGLLPTVWAFFFF